MGKPILTQKEFSTSPNVRLGEDAESVILTQKEFSTSPNQFC